MKRSIALFMCLLMLLAVAVGCANNGDDNPADTTTPHADTTPGTPDSNNPDIPSDGQYDENGYLIFNCIGENQDAMYITNGKRINVKWSKTSDTSPTRYYDGMGDEIKLNTGKTYVAFVADQRWDELVVQ